MLNFVEDSINRHFLTAQTFADAMQRDKRSRTSFDAHLNSLKAHLFFYIEVQRIIHLFIKFRSKLRRILTNYQDLFIIKKDLLTLITRLKNNMKRTSTKTTAITRSVSEKSFWNKNKKNHDKKKNFRNDKDSSFKKNDDDFEN